MGAFQQTIGSDAQERRPQECRRDDIPERGGDTHGWWCRNGSVNPAGHHHSSPSRSSGFHKRKFMTPVLTFRQPTHSPSPDIADVTALATCPGCHTTEPTLTVAAVAAGATWRCARCTQLWHAARLATVAGYASWEAGHAVSPIHQTTPFGSGV